MVRRAFFFLAILGVTLSLSCLYNEPIATPPPSSDAQKPQKDASIVRAIAQISDSSIASTIQALQGFGTRYYANPNRDSIATWIRSKFLSFGLTDVSFHSCQVNGISQKNVVATLSGSTLPTQEIIVCGHYDSYCILDYQKIIIDTLHAPGADDNASGTAGVIELARVFFSEAYRPHRTIRFICFAAEEMGCRGSSAYAQDAQRQGRDIRYVANFDMIAYHGNEPTTYRIDTRDTAGSKLAVDVAYLYSLDPPKVNLGLAGPDDASFLAFAFPQRVHTLFYSDLAHMYTYIHSVSDLFVNLDATYEKKILQSALATILTWDQIQ